MENRKKLNQLIQILLLLFIIQCLSQAVYSELTRPVAGRHFVLVHGAGHGAWCWYKLVVGLRSLGHNATALDLAASGINPKQVLDVPTISDYFRPLTEFMASLPRREKVILVGHSLGGLAISHVMEKHPEKIHVAVFVTAAMPGPSMDYAVFRRESAKAGTGTMDSFFTFDNGTENPPTTFTFGPRYLSERLYNLSPPEDAALANLLVRPVYLYGVEDISTTLALSDQNYGSVNRVFIISEEDESNPKYFQMWMIEQNPPNEVKTIAGSDHMVMMTQPIQLLNQLHDVAEKYTITDIRWKFCRDLDDVGYEFDKRNR